MAFEREISVVDFEDEKTIELCTTCLQPSTVHTCPAVLQAAKAHAEQVNESFLELAAAVDALLMAQGVWQIPSVGPFMAKLRKLRGI